MGMDDIFSNSADLSGLLASAEPLKVSEVHHSSSIVVDEKGAEAASATSKSINIGSKVKIDHRTLT